MDDREEYGEVFRALRDGEITFGHFARATAPLWRRQAASLVRRWRPPLWHSVDDVVQDMLLAASRFVWEWQPARGAWVPDEASGDWRWDARAAPDLVGFVVWNAYDKAKKRVHKARGAKLSGNADSNFSRIEKPLSSFVSRSDHPDDVAWWEPLVAREADQEASLASAEAALAACATPLERRVVGRLLRGETLGEVAEAVQRGSRAGGGASARAVVGAAVAVARRVAAA